MKKTLSMALALVMVMALVAVMPAMAADASSGSFTQPVDRAVDLSVYEDGTVLSSDTLQADGYISYAGTGSTKVSAVLAGDTAATTINYANFINISNQGVSSNGTQATVETVDGEKVIKLSNPVTNEAAGIALNGFSGADLLAGKTYTYYFDHYLAADGVNADAISIGLAVDNGAGLEYFEINKPVDGSSKNFPNTTYARTIPDLSGPVGVQPVFYYEGGVPKLHTTGRHDINNGKYFGPYNFGNGAPTFRDMNNTPDGAVLGVNSANRFSRWYQTAFKVSYRSGLGIMIQSDTSANPITPTHDFVHAVVIPLNSTELTNLSKVNLTPVIASLADANGSKYTYLKNIVLPPALKTYPGITSAVETVAGVDGFEGSAVSTANYNYSYNGSLIQAFGTSSSRMVGGYNTSDSAPTRAKVVANPNFMGNPSGKVLKLEADGGASPDYWVGWKTKAIPSAVFTSSSEGATLVFDMYKENTVAATNGRFYIGASKANGDGLFSADDSTTANKVMCHVTNINKGFQYFPNNSSGNAALGDAVNATSNWVSIALNVAPAADGTTVIKTRWRDNVTGVWSAWSSTRSMATRLGDSDYFTIALSFCKNSNTNSFVQYYDNFRIESAGVNTVAKISGGTDPYVVLPTDAVTASLDAPLASMKDAKNITLKAANGTAVDAAYSYAYVDGKYNFTLTPAADLEIGGEYYVDFAGLTNIYGQTISNASFIVKEDWDTISEAPVVTYEGKTSLVAGETAVITMETADGLVSTDDYAVYSSNGYVTVTANETADAYVVTAAGDGNAKLQVVSKAYPGAGITSFNVEATAPATVYTISYYVNGVLDSTELVGEYALPKGYTPVVEEGSEFAGWAETDGGEIVSFTAVTADKSYYAVTSASVTVTVVSSNKYGVADQVINVAKGGFLPAVPSYTPVEGAVLTGWQIGDSAEIIDTATLLATVIENDVTITAHFALGSFPAGEYKFNEMTQADWDVLPNHTNKTFVEGEGLQLAGASAMTQVFDFVTYEDKKVFVVEYDYQMSKDNGGFDARIGSGTINTITMFYHTNNYLYHRNAAGGATQYPNLYRKTDGVHTVKLIVDLENNRFYTLQDGVVGLTKYYDLSATNLPFNQLACSMKAGGSFVMSRLKFEALDSIEAVQVTLSSEDGISSLAFCDNEGKQNTSYNGSIYMPSGSKVQIGAKALDVKYTFEDYQATSGSFEDASAGYTWYTAGAEDATITKPAHINYVTATFDIGECTLVSGELSQTIIAGEAPVAPQVTAPEGTVFIGWSPAVSTITANTTFTAVYTAAETVDVNFVAQNPDLVTLDATAKAIKDGKLIALPGYVAKKGVTLLYWKDAEGNKYTNEQLSELTFVGGETFTGVFKQAYVDDSVFDFTKYDIESFFGTLPDALTTSVNEDGSLNVKNTTSGDLNISGLTFSGAESGVVVLTYDVKANTTTGGFNSEVKANGANEQSLFYIDGTVYTRASNEFPTPISSLYEDGFVYNGERHTVKLYYNMDNGEFKVSVDGKFYKPHYDKCLTGNPLNKMLLTFKPGTDMDIYALGAEVLTAEELPTAYTMSNTASVANAESAPTGTFYEGDVIVYVARNKDGYKFDGWFIDGAEEAVSTDLVYHHTVTANADVSAKYSERYLVWTYESTDLATFEEGATWQTEPFRHATIPGEELAQVFPTVIVAEGYEFVGWRVSPTSVYTSEVLSKTPASMDYVLTPEVKKLIDVTVSGIIVATEVSRTINVPVATTATKNVSEATIKVTYDDTVLEYAGFEVPEAYAGKVLVSETSTPSVLNINVVSETEIDINAVIANLKFKVIAKTDASEITYELISVSHLADTYAINSVAYTPSTIVAGVLKGDVNVDGKIDVYDAVAVLRNIAGITSLTEDGAKAADVNADNSISIADATQILKYIARLIANF